jgi:hypothetical protein
VRPVSMAAALNVVRPARVERAISAAACAGPVHSSIILSPGTLRRVNAIGQRSQAQPTVSERKCLQAWCQQPPSCGCYSISSKISFSSKISCAISSTISYAIKIRYAISSKISYAICAPCIHRAHALDWYIAVACALLAMTSLNLALGGRLISKHCALAHTDLQVCMPLRAGKIEHDNMWIARPRTCAPQSSR